MCVCIVCVYVCIHVMRVVRLPHKLTYCFFPFSWVDPTHSGGGHETGYRDHIYLYRQGVDLGQEASMHEKQKQLDEQKEALSRQMAQNARGPRPCHI